MDNRYLKIVIIIYLKKALIIIDIPNNSFQFTIINFS